MKVAEAAKTPTAIGAPSPGLLPVAALGDGSALMGVSELETVSGSVSRWWSSCTQLRSDDHPLDIVEFPPTDIARGFGFEAITVRTADSLETAATWVAGQHNKAADRRQGHQRAVVVARRGLPWPLTCIARAAGYPFGVDYRAPM